MPSPSLPPHAASVLTALDAIASDLLLQYGGESDSTATFWCGNFGLLLLDLASAHMVKPLLETMIRVTMMRGAQSAGIVTYTREPRGDASFVGLRQRVVAGKRTDLVRQLMRRFRGESSELQQQCSALQGQVHDLHCHGVSAALHSSPLPPPPPLPLGPTARAARVARVAPRACLGASAGSAARGR